jgi:hypothetical protein
MGNKVHVLMPTGNQGKKKLIEAFEGSRTHQLALEGKNGYAMPGEEQVANEQKKKPVVKSVAGKESTEELPTEKAVEQKPVIEEGIVTTTEETEQAPKAEATEKKTRKTKSK